MNCVELRISVLLSIQRALLGAITPNIRGIACAWNKSKITIYCYFDGEITEEDEDSMDCVATEVIADFLEHTVDLQCITVNVSESLTQHRLLAWVYMRKE